MASRNGTEYSVVTLDGKRRCESLAQARAFAKQQSGWAEIVAWDYQVSPYGGREHVAHRHVEDYDCGKVVRA